MGLNCPACKTEELRPFTVGNDTLDKCPACHGLWFNGEELRDVEELPESDLMNDFQDQLDDASAGAGASKATGRLCPGCGKTMNSYQYDVSSGIWIEGCPNGDGVWMDKGEVLKIHDHLQNAMKELPPEKMAAIKQQLKQIEVDEQKKEDAAMDSLFNHQGGSKVLLPLWHVMDGVMRFVYHDMARTGRDIQKLEDRL